MAFTQPDLTQSVLAKISEIVTPDCYPNGFCLDFDVLFSKINAKVYVLDPKNNASGQICLDPHNQNPLILINTEEPPLRQRFTLAHEVGHFISYKAGSYSKKPLEASEGGILERNFLTDRNTMTEEDRKCETEANKIAAEILMPREQVRKAVEKHGIHQSIPFYAGLFLVSSQSMAIRLDNLGYWIF